MNRCWELSGLILTLHDRSVHIWLQVVEATCSSSIHHHFVELLLRVLAFNQDGLVLEIFWIGSAFALLLTRCLCCGLLRLILSLLMLLGVLLMMAPLVSSFLALARHDPGQLNLLVLQDVRKHNASHVSVVGSLMVVRKKGLARIVTTLVLGVVLATQIALKFIVLSALLVHLAERGVVEGFRVVGQNFSIVSVREARVPLLSEL